MKQVILYETAKRDPSKQHDAVLPAVQLYLVPWCSSSTLSFAISSA
jgi:hypothetical protein